MKSAIIIANGDYVLKSRINYLIKSNVQAIIAADGGANLCYKLGIIPNYIVGDFDSIKSEVKEYFKNKSEFIHIKRQNDTDVEKSLKVTIRKKFKKVYLLGGTGDRLDHSICNLGIVLKFYSQIKVVVIHRESILIPYNGSLELLTIPKETVSLYAFNSNTIISSTGLKYPLKNSRIPFGEKESTSNEAVAYKVKLNIRGGIVFVIRNFNLMKKNDLIFRS